MANNQGDTYNKGGLIALLGTLGFVFAFFFYIVVVNSGVDLAQNVIDPNAPAADGKPVFKIADVKDPWVSTPEIAEYGHKVYKQNCALCHGEGGLGDGAGGATLNPKPRNFVEGKWTQGNGLIAHFKVLQKGIDGGGMASYKAVLKPADRWAVLHYIETLTNNKSQDSAESIAEFAKTAE